MTSQIRNHTSYLANIKRAVYKNLNKLIGLDATDIVESVREDKTVLPVYISTYLDANGCWKNASPEDIMMATHSGANGTYLTFVPGMTAEQTESAFFRGVDIFKDKRIQERLCRDNRILAFNNQSRFTARVCILNNSGQNIYGTQNDTGIRLIVPTGTSKLSVVRRGNSYKPVIHPMDPSNVDELFLALDDPNISYTVALYQNDKIVAERTVLCGSDIESIPLSTFGTWVWSNSADNKDKNFVVHCFLDAENGTLSSFVLAQGIYNVDNAVGYDVFQYYMGDDLLNYKNNAFRAPLVLS